MEEEKIKELTKVKYQLTWDRIENKIWYLQTETWTIKIPRTSCINATLISRKIWNKQHFCHLFAGALVLWRRWNFLNIYQPSHNHKYIMLKQRNYVVATLYNKTKVYQFDSPKTEITLWKNKLCQLQKDFIKCVSDQQGSKLKIHYSRNILGILFLIIIYVSYPLCVLRSRKIF